MSGHFSKLKEAGLIQADQRGTTILYSLNLSMLEEVLLGFMGRIGTGENGKEEGQ
jgi:DNA-binding transcriptional ArsR family regulator